VENNMSQVVGPGYEACGGGGRGFALVIVLFILLIIIGASFVRGGHHGHHGYGGYCC
jgi:uncharacterized protein (TIGR01732 family)